MSKVLRIWLALAVVFVGLHITELSAQDEGGGEAVAAAPADTNEGAPESPEMKSSGFADIVLKGGMVNLLIWCLIFLTSFATCAFMVNGALEVRREKILPDNVVTGVRTALDDGDLGTAMGICEQNPGPLSNILMAGFTNITEGYDVVQDAVGAATDMETEKVMQRINYLNLCGQIAPMLGLLGTVTGMVQAFSTLANESSAVRDKLLAKAIATALWTTVCGLLISVPALLSFTIYKNLATKVLLESEATVLDLIKILRNAEVDEGDEEELYEDEEEEY